jgi:7-keto-8-aminopelargonate synthetase-like enzyme
MGTLGKALGAHGAYICGSEALREFLINSARSFIFSTAQPAPVAAAAREALKICRSSEGDALRASLRQNLASASEQLGLGEASSAIIPWIIGGESEAMEISAELLDLGFLVPAIRYPTVAKGSARLRLALTAKHSLDNIQNLAAALATVRPTDAPRLQSR